MNSSEAAHRPSDIEAQYRGETRTAGGYQYWTTSQEDEEALDIRDQVASGVLDEKRVVKKPRRKIFAPGAGKRTVIRLASLVLLATIACAAYFVFNYVQVSSAGGDDQTRPADAAIVLGAAQYEGSPSPVLQERLDHAYNLYVEGTVDKIFVTGAAAPGDIETEGRVGADHLLDKGVDAADIEVIPEGTNTWEQLSASVDKMDELNEGIEDEDLQLKTVLLVSDEYHSYRLLAIADELDLEAYVSPSAVETTTGNYLRESAAVSIGRITGYERLSAFTTD